MKGRIFYVKLWHGGDEKRYVGAQYAVPEGALLIVDFDSRVILALAPGQWYGFREEGAHCDDPES